MGTEIRGDLLTIPLYLNTKVVFDMLATLEDGFTIVENVQTSQNKNKEENIEANIGSNNIFAFLNIGVKGNKKVEDDNGETINKEKTHTPVSLFQNLYQKLDENSLIVKEIDEVKVGDFVEINGDLKTNPVIDMLKAIGEVTKLVNLFSEKNGGKKNRTEQFLGDNKFYSQLDGLIDSLRVAGKMDIICVTDSYNAVLATDESYFLNNNMNEITDGRYRVLGKVVQIYKEEGEISLLRNTAFSKLQLDKMDEFKKAFESPEFSTLLKNREFATSVKAPVVMMIPIAIFI